MESIKRKNHILLVEDALINQQVAMRILKKLGYTVHVANNGVDALEIFQAQTFDLILMDCQMPLMDGYTATQEIRNLERTQGKSRIPIIAMTAHALSDDREKCLKADMDDYLAKPIDIALLTSVLEHWLYGNEIKNQAKKAVSEKSDEHRIIDMDRIHEIFGDDPKAIQEFMISFINSTNTLLKEIEIAIKNKDVETAKNCLHRLKGAASNSGIATISKICIKAEEKILQNDWEAVLQLYQTLNTIFQELQVEVAEKI